VSAGAATGGQTPELATLPRLASVGNVTQLRVIRSEWTKLHSLRSTRWSMGVAFVLTIVLPVLFALVTVSHWDHMSPHDRADRHPLDIATAGVNLSQLAIAVLGVLVITGEYSTGMIRASFTAVPTRLPVLWAKTLVFAVATLVLMVGPVLIAFFASQAILNGHHHILQISFSHGGVARSVFGGALYLTLIGVFALAIGAIIRNTAGGIAAFAGLFFVIPPLMNILPQNWNDSISKYLPSSAARDIFQLTHGIHDLSPAGGLLLFAGYCALALAIAAVLLVRRDT
jgi:ABC-2 type transport system permease protein